MQTIEINDWSELPENYTGIVETAVKGDKHWYLNGKRHRIDGPAIEYAEGDKCWYQNGIRHREDGPAVITASGNEFWHYNDVELDKNKIKQLLELDYPIEAVVKLVYYIETNNR